MNALELRALQTPLIVLILVIGLAAGIIYQLDQSLTRAKRSLAQQQSQLREARTRLQKSGDEKQLIVRHLGSYQSLERLGFVGEEQRLNWLEGSRQSNQQAQLYGIQYNIGAQQTYPYAGELDAGQLGVHQSVMRLNFQLLHEADLLRFFRALATQQAGFFSVDQCSMERLESSNGVRVNLQANLRAECDIAWITLKPLSAGDKKS